MEQQKHPSTPTLKRPQKHHYFNKKSTFTQRAEKLSIEDIDKYFDFSDDDDLIPPSPVKEMQARAAQGPKRNVQSATTSNRPFLDIELNGPFGNLAPFKTSSPIEGDEQDHMRKLSPIPFIIDEEEVPERVLQKTTDLMHTFEVVESPSERITCKKSLAPSKKVAAPQIGTFEVESLPERITLKKTPAPLKKVEAPQQGNGQLPVLVSAVSRQPHNKEEKSNVLKETSAPLKKLVTAQMHTFEVESPPERITLKRTPGPLKKVAAPQIGTFEVESLPERITLKKTPAPLMTVEAPQQGNGHPPVMAIRQEKPPNTAQEKKSNELKETPAPSKNLAALHNRTAQEPPVEKSSHGQINLHTFLQKLKGTGRSKPPPPMKICLPIRAPTPPPEEDEFRVLEEDVPLFQLSRKNKSRPRTKHAEVKGSAERFSKDTQPEEAENLQASGKASGTGDIQTGKIPSKERTAADKAEEEPKDCTTNGKEYMEMRVSGPKSRDGKERQDGKERAAKDRVKSTKGTRERIQEPDYVELQSQEPPGKGHGGQTRIKSTKRTRERIQEPDDSVELQSQEPLGKGHGGQTRIKSTKRTRERIQEPDSVELQSQELPGKGDGGLHEETDVTSAEEIRKPGGKLKCTSKDLADGTIKTFENASSLGKRKRKPPGEWWLSHNAVVLGLQNAVEAQDVDTVKISHRGEVGKTLKQSEPGQKAYKKKAPLTKVRKNKKQQHHTPVKMLSALSEQVQNQDELQQQADLNLDPLPSNSLVCPLEASITSGDRLFDSINHHTLNANVHNKQDVASLLPEKRRRKSVVCEVPGNDIEIPVIQLQKPNSKNPKRMQRMTAFEDGTTPYTDSNKHLFTVQEEQASLSNNAKECPTVEVVTETSAKSWPSKNDSFQNGKRRFGGKEQGFISGPSSMIALDALEDTLSLRASDEETLRKWFRIVWPATVNPAGQINPDVFRWFSYRGGMMGVCEDILHNDWCAGKMLLSSHMQKPLWVDHSATTVYNVLTSAVSVTIDGTVSQYDPGQWFSVPCGHAHGLKNLTGEPAVLYFNRMRSQDTDVNM